MGNRAQRVLEQVQIHSILDDNALEKLGVIDDKAATLKQGKYIKAVLDKAISAKGIEVGRKIMRPCGYQCISDKIIEDAKRLYRKADFDPPRFLELLNECHIGGGKLHMEDGCIIGIYDTCYCGLPKMVKNFPKEYCECSAGWFERLFSEVFGKAVEVIIIGTFLTGADHCRFKITNNI